MKLLSSLTAIALAGFLLAVFTAQHGCTSNCAEQLPVDHRLHRVDRRHRARHSLRRLRPGLPAALQRALHRRREHQLLHAHDHRRPDGGRCDVLVAFNPYTDGRQWEVIHLQFGQPTSAPGTCCNGYPVIGPSTYIIPDHPSQGGVYAYGDGGAQVLRRHHVRHRRRSPTARRRRRHRRPPGQLGACFFDRVGAAGLARRSRRGGLGNPLRVPVSCRSRTGASPDRSSGRRRAP